jgi:hypothetical protein
MPVSQHLGLPFLEAGQAQKHVTHNEALRMLDAIVHLSVLEIAASPPGVPEDGARYIVGDPATGAFAEKENQIAVFEDGAWRFFMPRNGWLACIEATQALLIYHDDAWQPPAVGELQNLSLLGVGTIADETNRFAAKLNKALWTARYVSESGDGDLRYTLNKEAGAHSLSLLMQSDWSGRAEIGLLGNDDLTMKVSDDGSVWREALVADRASGAVSFPAGIVEPKTGLNAPLYIPNPAGGDVWRIDASRTATPRTATLSGVSGATLTLSAAVAGPNGQWGRWTSGMGGRSRYRIWNTSKSPAQSAWVSDSPTTTTLTVTDAAHVVGWLNGETIRIGDPNPTGANTLQMVALDIAPYMLTAFGTVFPQKGLFLSVYVSSSDGPAGLDFSGTGAGGTAVGGNALSNGVRNQSSLPVATPTLSPISNSNLLFLRETLTGSATDLTVVLARILGFYV